MAITAQNLTMYVGDDIDLAVTIKDVNLNALNLTGALKIEYVVKKYELSTDILLSKSLGTGIAITNAPAGIIAISVDSPETSGANTGPYYHEIRLVDSNNKVSTVMTGTITLLPSDPM